MIHDLMAIELVALSPVISHTIIKQTHITFNAPANSWQQLKAQKLYLCKGIVLLNIAIWDVRIQYYVSRVGSQWST